MGSTAKAAPRGKGIRARPRPSRSAARHAKRLPKPPAFFTPWPMAPPIGSLTASVGFKQRVQDMILPQAVDLQIAARHPLACEAGPLQKLDRGDIGGQA